jgi:hypothetical protein
MSVEGTVTSVAAAVAAQLAGDRRCSPTETIGDLPDAQAAMTQICDLDPLVLGQESGADLAHSQPVERRDETDSLPTAVGLVATGPVVPGRPRDANLASRGQDAPPTTTQLHEPLTLGGLRPTTRPLLHTTRRRQHNLQDQGKCCNVD